VPVVEGDLSSSGGILLRSIERRLLDGLPSKVVLPDPLTFVDCAEDRHYGSREKLLFAYCDCVLHPELEQLSKSGVKYIQFSAPSLVARFRNGPVARDELTQLSEALRGALRGVRSRTGYHTFFGDASPYLPDLIDILPTDDIGFDLTQTDPDLLPNSSKGIIAGIVDSRSSYIETPNEISRRLGRLLDRSRTLILTPSADLQYVPRAVADAKLKNLAAARDRL
jgi:5-methyltetrahydropteroyltriglutamate--homocysteine methyltransferase